MCCAWREIGAAQVQVWQLAGYVNPCYPTQLGSEAASITGGAGGQRSNKGQHLLKHRVAKACNQQSMLWVAGIVLAAQLAQAEHLHGQAARCGYRQAALQGHCRSTDQLLTRRPQLQGVLPVSGYLTGKATWPCSQQ